MDLNAATVLDIGAWDGSSDSRRSALLTLDRIREVWAGFLLREKHCLDDCIVPESSACVSLKDNPRLSRIPRYLFYGGDKLVRPAMPIGCPGVSRRRGGGCLACCDVDGAPA